MGIKTEVIKRNIVDATRALGAQNEAQATTILITKRALSLNKALETKSEEDWEILKDWKDEPMDSGKSWKD